MTAVHMLTPVPLRDVWPSEAQDFTPWLAEHPEVLADALRMDLELEGTGVVVGSFSADLVFKATGRGRRVVVESLLERPDVDHRSKLTKYPAGVQDTGYGVLIAGWLGPKHRSALTWLNSVTNTDSGFFGIELRAFRIENSPPAISLDVVVEPDDWAPTVRVSVAPSTVGATSPARQLVGGASR